MIIILIIILIILRIFVYRDAVYDALKYMLRSISKYGSSRIDQPVGSDIRHNTRFFDTWDRIVYLSRYIDDLCVARTFMGLWG
jgi:hypothetical protein